MKYIDNDNMTIATKRTLKNLRQSLTDLLEIKALDKISIQELCDMAMISRGTFYNYFYDKYDLLSYDWTQLQLEIDPEFANKNLDSYDYQQYMHLFLENLIKHLSKEKKSYEKIIINNENSIFSQNMHDYIEEVILLKLKKAIEDKNKFNIPIELLATIYANTIIALGRWWLKEGENYTKKDVYNFFNILINHELVVNT